MRNECAICGHDASSHVYDRSIGMHRAPNTEPHQLVARMVSDEDFREHRERTHEDIEGASFDRQRI